MKKSLFALALIIFISGAPNLFTPDRAMAAGKDVLRSVVGLQTKIPSTARTSRFLGTQRQGSGVVIDDNGLVLTIGYLIQEANEATLANAEGKQVTASIVAYDHATGLGLLRAESSLGAAPMRLGK